MPQLAKRLRASREKRVASFMELPNTCTVQWCQPATKRLDAAPSAAWRNSIICDCDKSLVSSSCSQLFLKNDLAAWLLMQQKDCVRTNSKGAERNRLSCPGSVSSSSNSRSSTPAM